MWNLDNRTPFAADRSFARDAAGAEFFLVAVKATFTIAGDGSLHLDATQLPVAHAPAYRGRPDSPCLESDADLVLGKTAVDLLIDGHVHAPRGDAVRKLTAELRVGAWTKQIVAIGERRWERGTFGPRLSEAAPFAAVPLAWELAFGGPDEPRNPVGCGLVTTAQPLVGTLAPQLELLGPERTGWRQRPSPAGLGPVAPHWSPRREFAGTHDAAWQRLRAPLPPLDADARRHQCAPTDQQLALIGGELVELRHFTPTGLLRFTLPQIALSFNTRVDHQHVEHSPTMTSVTIVPDAARLIMVWQSALACHSTLHALRGTLLEVVHSTVALPGAHA